jgi:hypothetical protein
VCVCLRVCMHVRVFVVILCWTCLVCVCVQYACGAHVGDILVLALRR